MLFHGVISTWTEHIIFRSLFLTKHNSLLSWYTKELSNFSYTYNVQVYHLLAVKDLSIVQTGL